ncbi:MAG: hypothetical protein IJ595_10795 [Oscillospiraceae bacterium]|nr:hypothetical protein [Oscillospiraceae bacterium]
MKMIMPATLQVNPPDEPMPALQKIRVACYIRVSTDDPAQEEAAPFQKICGGALTAVHRRAICRIMLATGFGFRMKRK